MKKIVSFLSIIILIILTYIVSYKITLKDNYHSFLNILTYKYNKNKDYKIDFISLYIKNLKNKKHFLNETIPVTNLVYQENIKEPTIYIYSTHTNEEYNYQKNDLYNIMPTVKTASYILEDELKRLGLYSLVEKENTIDILNNRGLEYSSSYKISRELLEKRQEENPSLKLFFDIHRDSVKRSITTVSINNISYAKIMFLLGLENPNYLENKKEIEIMNNYLNTNYPGLSRGIYEKKGVGVNGVYNQDYSKHVFLIEVGGVDNTIEEVSNSIKILAETIYNYYQQIDKKE